MIEPHQPITASGDRSTAAHSIGNVSTGDTHIVLPAEVLNAARDIQAPPRTGNLAPPPTCVGRDNELSWLHRVLDSNGGTAVTQAPAVHGLGGIGKSTLALRYAHHHRDDYTLVWWINAESPARIEQSLAALTMRLHPSWASQASEQARAMWATNWLHWHPGWLLIFDNAEDPRDLHSYLGALTSGHHVVTTRRATGWPHGFPTRSLGTLGSEEAAAFLCDRALNGATPSPHDLHHARLLAADLGHLPLALDQAGAYLAQHPTVTLDTYRRTLGTKLAKAADGIDPERTITRIWTHTLAALEEHGPLPITVLDTLAWLAPDDIPLALLRHLGTEEELAEALGILRTYSMITLTRDTVGIHRLVQTVLRDQPDHPGRTEAEHTLAQALDALPEPPERGPAPAWDQHIPHLTALAATTPPDHHDHPVTRHYLTAAQYLLSQGHDARTIPLREVRLTSCEQHLGDTHPDTLAARNNLAAAYRSAGHLGRALPLQEATLTQSEQVLGHTHPDTLTSRNNLAYAYAAAGDLDRAIPLYETTLAQCERVLGHTHPDTLLSRNNLAGAYASAGDLDRAIPLYETTLAQREQVLGPTHPQTLTSRNNLAAAYDDAGDLDRAIPLYKTTLAQREQTLGPTHPQTLTSRNNLAYAYTAAGDLDRATPLHEATLAQREQVLGHTHPDTLMSRNNLAYVYQDAGDLDRAIALYETTLTQSEEVLGHTHPDTLMSRNNLAAAYKEAGHLGLATTLCEINLTQSEQFLGPTHPQTLATRDNLAYAYAAAGDLDRAIPLYETTLAQREQTLGPTHPQTLATRDNLAAALARQKTSRPSPAAGGPGADSRAAEESRRPSRHTRTRPHPNEAAPAARPCPHRQTVSSADPKEEPPPASSRFVATSPPRVPQWTPNTRQLPTGVDRLSTEIATLMTEAGPYLSAAVSAYGTAVLTRAEDSAVDATANLGRRLLQRVWRRGSAAEQSALALAVEEAATDTEDPDAAAALRQQIKRALREDTELLAEIAALVTAQPKPSISINAIGTRSIAAQHIGTAITGDGHHPTR
ncbi:FxSxx-COOH system tetratricopeptide repeat protein [Kitasatospora sp. NPDC058170]|uniref:FxSxx-COOH system tetratricopeptide repeat protein n=1 Tax=Kitasatospora sp. NPDC058170 TaxID=3346364 RepID=UPI0036DD3389